MKRSIETVAMGGGVGLVLFILLAGACTPGRAGEISYLERFALAPDRAVPLAELIPGTEEYFCFHALDRQHAGRLDEARAFINDGVKKYGRTASLRELENRQALLDYERNPKASLDYIVHELNLQFNHQRKQLNPEIKLPTRLDPAVASFDTLSTRALSEPRHLGRFEDSAFDYLVKAKLTDDQRRHLLSRLQRPDYPGLVELIVADLDYKNSGGFGSHPVHRELTLEQLDDCLKRKPALLTDSNFINVHLSKLRPNEDVDWQHDDEALLAYLVRLEAFVERLSPAQNSLKANVLYQRLDFERRHGRYDRERFMRYIQLPRPVFYVNPEYLRRRDFVGLHVNMGASFDGVTALPPIGMDEPLVRDYLAHFLLDAPDAKAFADTIESNYLKRLLAETKLVNGVGDPEQWYALMAPAEVKALRDRVDIDLLPANPTVVGVADPVAIDVAVKNVAELVVKTYEINTTAYYRQNRSEITTAIELDGLVANAEQVQTYTFPPMRRHVERLTFPAAGPAGVYVIELIGNGISSRALIRKGRLTFTERIGAAGHAFRIHDERGEVLSDATLWLDGREFKAAAAGEIRVPFSGSPGRKPIVLTHGTFSMLSSFEHLGEHYELSAGFHVGRERLVAGSQCLVAVRPQLTVNGEPVAAAILEEPLLTIRSTDLDGLSAEKQVKAFELFDDRESTYSFRVPERLRSLDLVLSGTVRNMSTGEKLALSTTRSVLVNGINETASVEDLHVRRSTEGYVVELLGRSGETRADRPLQVELKHRAFTETVHATLKTDERGRAGLGALEDIDWVRVTGPTEGVAHVWTLPRDRSASVDTLHVLAGERFVIPCMDAAADRPLQERASLLEKRGGVFVRDCLDKVAFEGGFLVVAGLEPGDYHLLVKSEQRALFIRVTAGRALGSQLLGRDRVLEQRAPAPLQIVDREIRDGMLRVRIAHADSDTRVHVGVTRFVTDDLFAQFGAPRGRPPQAARLMRPESSYVSGRNIGDEFRYVMERRGDRIYPGNMLTRPSLLLNPWSPRATDTGTDEARAGGVYATHRGGADRANLRAFGMEPEEAFFSVATDADFACFDFLPDVSPLVVNRVPDKDGVVEIPLTELPKGQQLMIYAVNAESAVCRQLALAERAEEMRDLRLLRPLPPDGHFTEQKRVSIVAKGGVFTAADALSAKVEWVDSLRSAYRLLAALRDDPAFAEFSFVLDWPTLDAARKGELYRQYACHELHLFLARKDPEFFARVVAPYLANKKDPTFLDDYLLNRPLDAYQEPWAYERLNMAERALLGRALAARRGDVARHVRDRYDLIPQDVERSNRLFDSAIRAGGLEANAAVDAVMELAEAEEKQVMVVSPGVMKKLSTARMRDEKGMALVAMPTAPAAAKPQDAAKAEGAARVAPVPEPIEMAFDVPMESAADAGTSGRKSLRRQAMKDDLALRDETRPFYRQLDETREWVESHYYRRPIGEQVAELVPVNAFWKDYAAYDGEGPFLSGNLAEAAGSFAEMMLALAVLDLPFEAAEHDIAYQDGGMVIRPAGDLILYHQQIQPAGQAEEQTPLLVSQNFFAGDDRYRFENNERFDKFVTGRFEKGRVYGCQVVLTNPTSTRRKVAVIQQVPAGAIPVLKSMQTMSRHAVLEPYSTQAMEFFFYFPAAGEFTHYPVHVAQNEEVVAAAKAVVFDVADKVTEVDTESWEHVSQYAEAEAVAAYLRAHNIDRLDLGLIAWRMRDRAVFDATLELLRGRLVYSDVLWSYGLFHNAPGAIREYLPRTSFADACGPILESPLLTLDPIARRGFEHKEYWPLVNARVFKLGSERKILNRQFYEQYEAFMKVLTYRPRLTDPDRMAVSVYMLLQDRVEEGLRFFEQVDVKGLSMGVQADYLAAYLAFYREAPAEARRIAARYREYPVERWQKLFGDVLAQCDEIDGKASSVVDSDNRDQQQAKLADTEPRLDLVIEGARVEVRHANLSACTLHYYPMDIELLFSRQPFVQDVGNRFAMIRPTRTDVVTLDGAGPTVVPVPKELEGRNLMIEAVGAGVSRLAAYYPNTFDAALIENYGQAKITDRVSGKPLSKVYVKVYARMQDGRVAFYKDGYTDLRGRFDYTSLNTGELDSVERFAILILSDTHGALVREAAPPKK